MCNHPEWINYQVGNEHPLKVGSDCRFLTTVSHVAHIDTALRIITDGNIEASLVFDESKLRAKRILVTWLSPNDWTNAGGFRYGNIRFTFKWEQLIRNKKYYWVEVMTEYKPSACRILITSEDRGNDLEEYDPTLRNGPWWYDKLNGRHHWNSQYCLEFMLERDLSVRESLGMDFVDHSPKYCSIHRTEPSQCVSLGLHCDDTSAFFLAALVGYGVDPSTLKLTKTEASAIVPNRTLKSAWAELERRLNDLEGDYKGELTSSDGSGLSLARCILVNYFESKRDDLFHLLNLFRSKYFMVESCARVTARHFQLTDIDVFTPSDF